MARKVKFNINDTVLESGIVKVDRAKLYGSTKKIVRDMKGNECVLSNLYNGDRILPTGSISQVLLDNEGLFVSRSALVGFNSSNKKVDKVSSIFSIENKCEKVDLDETGAVVFDADLPALPFERQEYGDAHLNPRFNHGRKAGRWSFDEKDTKVPRRNSFG